MKKTLEFFKVPQGKDVTIRLLDVPVPDWLRSMTPEQVEQYNEQMRRNPCPFCVAGVPVSRLKT